LVCVVACGTVVSNGPATPDGAAAGQGGSLTTQEGGNESGGGARARADASLDATGDDVSASAGGAGGTIPGAADARETAVGTGGNSEAGSDAQARRDAEAGIADTGVAEAGVAEAGRDASSEASGMACEGAGICGRAPTGISCAYSNGASEFIGRGQWSSSFADNGAWNSTPSFWATIQFPDVNGDGRADICGRGAAGIYCALAVGGAFGAPTLWTPGYSDAGGWNAQPYYWATIRFPDINGDGRADVCGRSSLGIDCAVSNGVDGFGPVTTWSTTFSNTAGWQTSQSFWGTIDFPDLNGDKKADMCGRGMAGVYCAVSNGTNAFGDATLWQGDFSDTNGWNALPSYWGTFQYPDVNGDGDADVCGRGMAGVYCAISNGTNGFGPATIWSSAYATGDGGTWTASQSHWGTILFPDLNGDGRADVCGRSSDGLLCALSTGTTFSGASSWSSAFNDAAGFAGDSTRWGTIQFIDLDGDGRSDVCGRTSAGVICARSTGSAFRTATLWIDQFSDLNGWGTDLSYGATLQLAPLNVPGCTRISRTATANAPARRLPVP
jgi:hypothetical protein